eukprot:scaffold2451_cov184-Ochromonas_danica.AAC.1
MECKSISCDSNDEDSDENALSISFIFSSCSSSFSSGSSSKMFEDEVPQTLVRYALTESVLIISGWYAFFVYGYQSNLLLLKGSLEDGTSIVLLAH